MQEELVLLPILFDSAERASVVVGSLTDTGWSCDGDALYANADDRLCIAPFTDLPASEAASTSGAADLTVVARFRCRGNSGKDAALAITAESRDVLASGLPIYSFRLVHPGQPLSLPPCGEFLLVRRYRAEAQPAPERVAEKACAVCGMPLGIAPVAACSCGTWYHAEDCLPAGEAGEAGEPDDEPLRCFTKSRTCITCKREKSWEARLLPDPAELGFGVAGAALPEGVV